MSENTQIKDRDKYTAILTIDDREDGGLDIRMSMFMKVENSLIPLNQEDIEKLDLSNKPGAGLLAAHLERILTGITDKLKK